MAMSEEDALDEESDRWRTAVLAPHRLGVNLRSGGVNFTITCGGDTKSQCHLWRDEPNDPNTLQGHPTCSISDWFYEDTRGFVEDGYVGPERDGLIGGQIIVLTWGEDGSQWHYRGDKPSWE